MTDRDPIARIREAMASPGIDDLDAWDSSMIGMLIDAVLSLSDRVAALEAERDRRESYEQEQNERG